MFPASLMARSKEARPPSPPWWYDTATSTWESGNFRLRASSRIVIAVHERRAQQLDGVRPRRRAPPTVGAADRELRYAGTAVERAGAVNVAGHHSLWVGSAIVLRIRHRAFLSDFDRALGWPVRADRGSRSVYTASSREPPRASAQSHARDHVSADHPLDVSEARSERPPNRRQRECPRLSLFGFAGGYRGETAKTPLLRYDDRVEHDER